MTSGDDTVTRVARDDIRARLLRTDKYLRLSAKHAADATENVHQLRVATRRSQVSLEVFADVLSPRKAARMSKQLRRLRRLAGRARDLDVLMERLHNFVGDSDSAPRRMLVEHLRSCRHDVQRPIKKAWKKARREGFRDAGKDLARKIRWRCKGDEPTFRLFAAGKLELFLNPFVAASQKDFQLIENVHDFRKTGKRMRYAFELLGKAFDPRKVMAILTDFRVLQDQLGDINDHAVAHDLFSELSQTAVDKPLGEWLSVLAEQSAASLELAWGGFLANWDVQAASRLQSKFAALIDAQQASA